MRIGFLTTVILSVLLNVGCNGNSKKQIPTLSKEDSIYLNNLFPKSDNSIRENHMYKSTNITESTRCTEYEMEIGVLEDCIHIGKSLEEVYSEIQNKHPSLLEKLPKADTSYQLDEQDIHYEFKNRQHLDLKIFYEYGIYRVELIESKGHTISSALSAGD